MSFHLITVSDTQVGFHVLNVGATGPAGTLGNDLQVAFSWGDAYPALLGACPIGKTVHKVEVIVLAAFNTASTMTVGDASDNAILAALGQIDLTVVGTYQTNPNIKYLATTNLNVYLSLVGGNTVGNGLILIYIQE